MLKDKKRYDINSDEFKAEAERICSVAYAKVDDILRSDDPLKRLNEVREFDAMPLNMAKADLINLLKGIGVPYGGMEPYTFFSGNQHNEAWEWNVGKLKALSESELLRLYHQVQAIKEKELESVPKEIRHLIGTLGD